MSLKISMSPINDRCYPCNKVVSKVDRQQITWDDKGNCRRMCGHCIEQENKAKSKY